MASIFDIISFKDIEIKDIQNDNDMVVVPLVGPDRGLIASPSNLQFHRTTDYGKMQFKNNGDKPAIIPTNFMVRGSGGQDHAMTGSGIINAKTTKVFSKMCCIEESQGGFLGSLNNKEDILPVELRKILVDTTLRQEDHYNKLWGQIKNWLNGLKINNNTGSAHLSYFYDNKNIQEELEEFAAAFEPVEGQIGAIILFGGTPVGLEIMPSAEHWNTYWKHLIRGCYGAELLRLKMLNKIQPSTIILPDIPKGATSDQVKEVLENFMKHLREEVIPLMANITISNVQTISKSTELETKMITTQDGGGDIIFQNSEPIYVSLVL